MPPRLSNSQVPISGFRFQGHLIRTYFDQADNRWVFEQWEGGTMVDRRYFPRHARHAENLFARACNRILTMHNVRRPPYLPRHHLPAGPLPPGVKTFNPAKARGVDLFTYYRINKISDE